MINIIKTKHDEEYLKLFFRHSKNFLNLYVKDTPYCKIGRRLGVKSSANNNNNKGNDANNINNNYNNNVEEKEIQVQNFSKPNDENLCKNIENNDINSNINCNGISNEVPNPNIQEDK